MTAARIAPTRKRVQWLTSLLVLGLPFAGVGGESLLRMDAASLTLLLFGARIRIEEFHLFLLAALVIVFGFLFITMAFGRVWCGWFCPQTTLSDLADYLDRKLAAIIPVKLFLFLSRQLCYLLLSALVAANLVWYFIPPAEFSRRLLAGNIGIVAGITLVLVTLVMYLDLALVRRLFCTVACPYGRLQLLSMDRNTLALEFDPARAGDCLRCGACCRACPMGIDIRKGLQIECINCGRCLDACRDVMEPHGKKGLIGYRFGVAADGGGTPFNRRTFLMGGFILLLCLFLGGAIVLRPEATIKVQRGGNGEVFLPAEGGVVNFFSAYVANRSATDAVFSMELAAPPAGTAVELLGPVRKISLAANSNLRVDFAVKLFPAPARECRLELRLVKDGKAVAVSPVTVLPR